jgi:uncharacterized protein (TIGR02231 family)
VPDLDAPITAVTVHPALARITRRGVVTVDGGSAEVVVGGLPATLDPASVRVAGRGATAARIVGVEVRDRRAVDAPDERVSAAEASLEEAWRGRGALEDLDTAEAARAELLASVGDRGGRAFAQALASGEAEPARLTSVAESLSSALLDVAGRRRALASQRLIAERTVAAAQAELDRLRASGRDRRDVMIAVEADAAGPLELEVDYVVRGAGWRPVYDFRVDADTATLELTWVALLQQSTGEDWPECELRVSTSRPAGAARIPELDPWWVDVWEPPRVAVAAPPPQRLDVGELLAHGEMAPAAATRAFDAEAEVVVAQAADSALAASWVLPRPIAVPGDGAAHRHVLESASLEARLDHVTAPAVAAEAQLRATVTNTTGRALLAGEASVFLDRDFVGVARVDATAPGGDLELALGVDDRVVVERELAGRDADKRRLGTTRSTNEAWTIEVTNHRDQAINLVVRDRLPQSRHADIKVADVKLEPKPAEHDDLGRVEWTATVPAGAAWKARMGFAVEHPKGMRVAGWR